EKPSDSAYSRNRALIASWSAGVRGAEIVAAGVATVIGRERRETLWSQECTQSAAGENLSGGEEDRAAAGGARHRDPPAQDAGLPRQEFARSAAGARARRRHDAQRVDRDLPLLRGDGARAAAVRPLDPGARAGRDVESADGARAAAAGDRRLRAHPSVLGRQAPPDPGVG